MNRLSPTQLQDYCNDYIKTPNGKVLIVVVQDNDVNKCTMPEDIRYVIDANKECRFVFGNPQYSLTSNKKNHELTKAIIGTNIGEEDFDADWIAFYLHLARAIEKPIIIILTEEFYNTEECWPSLLFDVVEYAYPNLEEWLKWESQKSGVRLNDKIEEYIATGPKRPLLIWFHSNREIDEARRCIINNLGCVWCDKYIYEKDGVIIEKRAIAYNEDTRLFLFHPLFGQLKAPRLEYAANLMNKTGIPVVYLVNDYSKDEEPQADISAFEECNTFAYL